MDWRLGGQGQGASLGHCVKEGVKKPRIRAQAFSSNRFLVVGFFFWFVCFFRDQITFSVLGWVVTRPLGGDAALP